MKYKFLVSILTLSCSLGLAACHQNNQQQNSSKHQARSDQHVQKSAEINLEKSITLDPNKMIKHLQALQNIATQNKGNRAVGTSGDQASAQYIISQAKLFDYPVQIQPFKSNSHIVGQNILVKIPGQNEDSSIIIGAHYDSVKTGPGINDNASGVALLLELMNQLHLAKIKPKQTIYLAFWDAGEAGKAGSKAYVDQLSPQQLKTIRAYINVNMVGTKNPIMLLANSDVNQAALKKEEKVLDSKQDQKEIKDMDRLLTDEVSDLPPNPKDLALKNSLREFMKSQNSDLVDDMSSLTDSDAASFLGKVPVTSMSLFHQQSNGAVERAVCDHKACDRLDQVDPKSLTVAGGALLHLIQNTDQ
ncbi:MULTISPECIES: M28 family metallopeptidase [unclassified Acinetobacter]|uniref:M28 family metallopeptidase n=1 Tax=unclassified Acinetobacter TaxID=196816 RepID=UPI0029342D4E|nr:MULTISPECIES: M20/M25/M40 family metallo-hydrolase [unclassified Acinetobacter]WOE31600.1 M20/M25/M40 family metallo-hydrolase [Acinetobacter sp. SAAs470]WOE37065.1 M20/M25/M40 family metallo-hydrolase [Acinetobacter sp. SAAs474]